MGIERINVATYQSVSGAGQGSGRRAGAADRRAHEQGRSRSKPQVIAKQIAFNVVPQIDVFQDNGYTKEEMKMVWETHKILEDQTIRVNATAVRVPVFFGHSEAVHIETRRKITRRRRARSAGKSARESRSWTSASRAGIPRQPPKQRTATQFMSDASGKIFRHERGLNLWIVSDNVRKGAATNSVQIAEILVREHI